MATLTCTWNAFLWESTRAPPDDTAIKGYNVYQSDIQLQGFVLPVWVALHQTLRKRYRSGILARVVGVPNVYERSVLIVADTIIPATLGPLPGIQPAYFHLLPRFTFTGVVVLGPRTHARNANCFCFDVGILRRDLFPVAELRITAWANRDADRLAFIQKPALQSSVTISGVFCGWSTRNSLMVDIHTIDPNYAGPASPVQIAAPMNPFEQATFDNGVPEFPDSAPKETFVDVFSRHAPPTRITYQHSPTPDPRLRPAAQGRPVIPPIRLPPLGSVYARSARADAMEVDAEVDAGQATRVGDFARGTHDQSPDSSSGPSGARVGAVSDATVTAGVVSGVEQSAAATLDDPRDDESHVADVASSDSGLSGEDSASVRGDVEMTSNAVGEDSAVYTHPPIATLGIDDMPRMEVSSSTFGTAGPSYTTVQDVRDAHARIRGRRTGQTQEAIRAPRRIKTEPTAPSLIAMA